MTAFPTDDFAWLRDQVRDDVTGCLAEFATFDGFAPTVTLVVDALTEYGFAPVDPDDKAEVADYRRYRLLVEREASRQLSSPTTMEATP